MKDKVTVSYTVKIVFIDYNKSSMELLLNVTVTIAIDFVTPKTKRYQVLIDHLWQQAILLTSYWTYTTLT